MMDYGSATEDTLLRMYEDIRSAHASGEVKAAQSPDFKKQADEIEAELDRRNVSYKRIDWKSATGK